MKKNLLIIKFKLNKAIKKIKKINLEY